MTPDYLFRARYLAPDARGAQPVARTAEPVVDAVWRWVPGYEGAYRVSDQGVIESVPRYGRPNLIQMRTQVDADGYLRIHLWKDGVRATLRAHRLVALAFLGPCPDGLEVRHLNGDPSDNRLVNLAYGTHSENAYDLVRHGNNPQARKTHCINGHEFSAENTYVNASGWRRCRACSARINAKHRATRAKRLASGVGGRAA